MSRPMIVVEDRETGAIFAHMCSQKGPGDKWIVRRIKKISKRWATVAPASSSSVTKRIPWPQSSRR